MEAVWPDSIVEENNLTQNIYTLRRVFGESPNSHQFIVTVPGRGYRFVADVRTVDRDIRPSQESESSFDPTRRSTEAPLQPGPVSATALRELTAFNSDARLKNAKTVKIAPVLLLIGVLVIMAILFVWVRDDHPTLHASAALAPSPIREKGIAVLPFENLSADPENAYFTTGVQEEILSNLAKIADLKVISRTSVNLYKSGTTRNAREIGQELGVTHLLEGSVQRSANHLRIHAQLIDSRTDSHIWAQTYDRDLVDLFAIQSEIAQTIVAQLDAKISERERASINQPKTSDLVANDLYQEGLALESQAPQPESLLKAIGFVERAVQRDPQFMIAYCALARMHLICTNMGYDHATPHREMAEAAIKKATELQPDAGEVHLAQGWYLGMERREYDRARAELELARHTLPNSATLYFQIAYVDRRQGRWNEAVRNLEWAVTLDPHNQELLFETANTYQNMHRYAEAAAFGRRVLANSSHNDYNARLFLPNLRLDERADLQPLREELEAILREKPDVTPEIACDLLSVALYERNAEAADRALAAFPPGEIGLGPGLTGPRDWCVGLAARVFDRPEEATRAFETVRSFLEKRVVEKPDDATAWALLGLAEAALGHKEKAIEAGRRACDILPVSKEPLWGSKAQRDLAKIYAWAGEKELASRQLATVSDQLTLFHYGDLKLSPDWDPLRGDPRFEKLVASLAPKTP